TDTPRSLTSLTASILNSRLNFRLCMTHLWLDKTPNLGVHQTGSSSHPAAFLAKKGPPPRIQYKRVTPRFFAVSSYKGDKVFYDRCNFSGRLVHCVLINYPAEEERAWDDVVTRISLSLNGK
ncbi:hypothetical protein Bra1253DRAFT_00022, partial [Bradyrhizobium sp. WSM1253]